MTRTPRISWPSVLLLCAAVSIGAAARTEPSVTYVALDASDSGAAGLGSPGNGYMFKIHEQLARGTPSAALINIAVPGGNLAELAQELDVAKEQQPTLVTVIAGENDLMNGVPVAQFEHDLRELLSTLRRETEALVVVATLPDFSQAPLFQELPNRFVTSARVRQFNEAILRQAEMTSAAVADLRNFPITAEVTAADGVAPNSRGHQIIADQFLNAIGIVPDPSGPMRAPFSEPERNGLEMDPLFDAEPGLEEGSELDCLPGEQWNNLPHAGLDDGEDGMEHDPEGLMRRKGTPRSA